MADVTIYSKGYCQYCKMAKASLSEMGVLFKELDITNNAQLTNEMHQLSKRRTVPQIFIDAKHIGGFDDLQVATRNGELTQLLQAGCVEV